jgi:hypothetical protein
VSASSNLDWHQGPARITAYVTTKATGGWLSNGSQRTIALLLLLFVLFYFFELGVYRITVWRSFACLTGCLSLLGIHLLRQLG